MLFVSTNSPWLLLTYETYDVRTHLIWLRLRIASHRMITNVNILHPLNSSSPSHFSSSLFAASSSSPLSSPSPSSVHTATTHTHFRGLPICKARYNVFIWRDSERPGLPWRHPSAAGACAHWLTDWLLWRSCVWVCMCVDACICVYDVCEKERRKDGERIRQVNEETSPALLFLHLCLTHTLNLYLSMCMRLRWVWQRRTSTYTDWAVRQGRARRAAGCCSAHHLKHQVWCLALRLRIFLPLIHFPPFNHVVPSPLYTLNYCPLSIAPFW